MSILRLGGLAALLIGLTGATSVPHDFAEGQVWEYHTRPSDPGSLLRIQKIEKVEAFAKLGPVYHISIIGVHFENGPVSTQLQHLPVSRETLDASVTHLSTSTAAFPDPTDGIAAWRSAKGGVFTIPLDRVVAFVEQTIQQHPDR